MLTSSAFAFANDAARVPVEATDASVAYPAGWVQMPLTSDPPSVMFVLCDQSEEAGCLVQGEITLGLVPVGRKIESLDHELDAAKASVELASLAHKVRIGPYDAVETNWTGQHSNHIQWAVTRGNLLIETTSGYYDCMLTTAPDRFPELADTWRSFCASLDLEKNQTGLKSHG